ncbi:dihydrodipicolinate synthase family protein [Jannaschia seohaensis]|uniref:4-hydroxy-tetrahydrodipicolinate synthase n=1 Tax=Jannaschia seohaensis TaxID=475081 RepID=A0A2Y9B0H3_9RHOB|nr:dihydrodipicolinate synthase family protein [Jannaschia seohaensis]PWJ17040.1 4-hydroxy-tetrahydrodipicolinate synthase [Jannaschia seohaensis]SSA48377.1 4-hydroxy-tetrahydrodipicolinate synthase [Jannaschia seohaensis]
MTAPFTGSYTVTITPFTEGGDAIDYDAWARFLDWQVASGVPGIIILGTTGEFLTITDEERSEYVARTVELVNGRMKVLVGSMNAYTPNAVRYSVEAERLGADGLMIIPPYYYTPTEDEIFNYYKAICEACGLPIMLYNNPFTSNVDMPARLVGRLTKSFEQIRYIKEASQRIERIHDIILESDGLMNVWAGQRVLESYKMGAVGYVNPYGNYIPRASVKFVEWAEQGRWEDVQAVQSVIGKFDAIITEGHPLYGHQCYSKALAAAAGYPVGDVRAPITTFESLGEEGRARVAKMVPLMEELDRIVDAIEARPAAAE